MNTNSPRVGIIMGSDSDLNIMQEAAQVLEQFSVPFELTIVSAHRTPERMMEYAREAAGRGIQVIIAGAGGAAHLPGMVASITTLPVIGVPIKSSNSIDGWDSVLSILQMPAGVPVATVALNGAKNAGLLAVQILGSADTAIANQMAAYKQALGSAVLDKVKSVQEKWPNQFDEKKTLFFAKYNNAKFCCNRLRVLINYFQPFLSPGCIPKGHIFYPFLQLIIWKNL